MSVLSLFRHLLDYVHPLRRARAKRYRELRAFQEEDKSEIIFDVKCAACGFVNPIGAIDFSFPCAWCGQWIKAE